MILGYLIFQPHSKHLAARSMEGTFKREKKRKEEDKGIFEKTVWGCAVWSRLPFVNSWMDSSEYGVLRLGQKAAWSLLGVCSIARPPSDTVVTHYLNTHGSRGLERSTRDWVINPSHQGLGQFLKRLISQN